MRKPGSIIIAAWLAIVAAGIDPGRLRAQSEVPVQPFTITETQLRTHAPHGTSREAVHAALGQPLLKECGEDMKLWSYRVDNDRRVGLLFQDGPLSLTILGDASLDGERHLC